MCQSQDKGPESCIVINGEQFQSHAVTFTSIGKYLMLNSSELFSYTTICSSFMLIDPLFYLVIVYTGTHTDTRTDGHYEHDYCIVEVDNPKTVKG